MVKHKQPNDAEQKGSRRQRIHDKQDTKGNDKNKPEYENFNGDPIQ